jgi:phage protein D
VQGRPQHSVARIDRRIAGADADAIVQTDLADQSNAPLRAVTATELRRTLLGTAALPTEKAVEFSNLDEERAMIKAHKTLLDGAREMLTVEASTIGFPALRPGVHVRIQGLYPPFNGIYYVTKAIHALDGSGYRTNVTLRRPGMLPPGKYPMSVAAQAKREEDAS